MASPGEHENPLSRWAWGLQYATALVLVLLITTLLGRSQLFANAPLAPRGLTAAHLVQFLGYGAALWLLWLAACRVATALPEDGEWRSLARRVVIPFTAVLVLAVGYQVPLILLGPYLTDATRAAYSWLFVLAITAAAVWLSVTTYQNAGALIALVAKLVRTIPPRLHGHRGDSD